MPRNISHLFALFLMMCIIVNGAKIQAQNSRLSSQQQETITQLIKERSRNTALVQQIKKVADPILVGRHIVFATEWLELVGNGKNGTITRQQFLSYRNRMDRLYECYEKFVGHKPRGGDKIFIKLRSLDLERAYWIERYGFVPAGLGGNEVTINRGSSSVQDFVNKQGMRSSNSLSFTMMHEVAHAFENRSPWVADSEVAADFLVYYALENGGFRNEREDRYVRFHAIRNHSQNVVAAFSGQGKNPHANRTNNAYGLYMYGIVDVVGWETFRKTIQSYHNGTYTPTRKYEPNKEKGQTAMHARAHEFFDRLAYFYGDARVLWIGPDRGTLLNKYFTVNTTLIAASSQSGSTGRSSRLAFPTIFEAAAKGRVQDVEDFVNQNPASVHAKDGKHNTPLHYAAGENHNADVLKFLVSKGADVNAKNMVGRTPLGVADTTSKKNILRAAMERK
ncbi:MAG: hypothetical protein LBI05_07910 [Planctomycetaceae bacterium]|jgi:hypothetical protein|nr:hypothetical protein [Planctomycetaceae bacterium]